MTLKQPINKHKEKKFKYFEVYWRNRDGVEKYPRSTGVGVENWKVVLITNKPLKKGQKVKEKKIQL